MTETSPRSDVHVVDVGESVSRGGWTVTIDTADLVRDCGPDEPSAPEGSAHLHVAGTASVASDARPEDPDRPTAQALHVIVDDRAEFVPVTEQSPCLADDPDTVPWNEISEPGEDIAFSSTYLVPDNTEHLVITAGESSWRLPVIESPSSPTTTLTEPPTPANPQAANPTLIECIHGGGAWTDQGLMSDGSYGYHPDCAAMRAEQLAANPYQCPQTDHFVPGPEHCAPVPPPQQPSPWVQGQIDWTNCLEAGNSEEFCRESLNN